jgi:predicted TIM-barrel fold metal-dependent hydrolase
MIREMFQGVPRPTYNDSRPHVHPLGKGLVSGPYVLYAFQQILGSRLLDDFPKLRVAFLEAGADWTVRLIKGLRASKGAKIDEWLAQRVFVSCAIDDDIPYIKSKVGDDFLVTATDFPHGDAFRQDQLANGLKARGDLSDQTIEKILSDNPLRLFHL